MNNFLSIFSFSLHLTLTIPSLEPQGFVTLSCSHSFFFSSCLFGFIFSPFCSITSLSPHPLFFLPPSPLNYEMFLKVSFCHHIFHTVCFLLFIPTTSAYYQTYILFCPNYLSSCYLVALLRISLLSIHLITELMFLKCQYYVISLFKMLMCQSSQLLFLYSRIITPFTFLDFV